MASFRSAQSLTRRTMIGANDPASGENLRFLCLSPQMNKDARSDQRPTMMPGRTLEEQPKLRLHIYAVFTTCLQLTREPRVVLCPMNPLLDQSFPEIL